MSLVNRPGWTLCECGHDVGWHHGVYGCCWGEEGSDKWPGDDGCRMWRPVGAEQKEHSTARKWWQWFRRQPAKAEGKS